VRSHRHRLQIAAAIGTAPSGQGAAARQWLAEREAELLPVPYFHVVYTLPAEIGDNRYQNKAVIYDHAVQSLGRDHAHDRGGS